MVSKYEIGFIITPEANEEEVKKVIEAVVGIIKKAKGTIDSVDEWGRKNFAYPIGKLHEGYYVFVKTDCDGGIVSTLERRLRQMEKVLRFIVLRLDVRLQKSNKLTKRWAKIDQLKRKPLETKSEKEVEAAEPVTTSAETKEEKHAE